MMDISEGVGERPRPYVRTAGKKSEEKADKVDEESC